MTFPFEVLVHDFAFPGIYDAMMLNMSHGSSGEDLPREMAMLLASPPLHGFTSSVVNSAALLEHLYPTYCGGQYFVYRRPKPKRLDHWVDFSQM